MCCSAVEEGSSLPGQAHFSSLFPLIPGCVCSNVSLAATVSPSNLPPLGPTLPLGEKSPGAHVCLCKFQTLICLAMVRR